MLVQELAHILFIRLAELVSHNASTWRAAAKGYLYVTNQKNDLDFRITQTLPSPSQMAGKGQLPFIILHRFRKN